MKWKKFKNAVKVRNPKSPKWKRQCVQEKPDKETKNEQQSRREQERW